MAHMMVISPSPRGFQVRSESKVARLMITVGRIGPPGCFYPRFAPMPSAPVSQQRNKERELLATVSQSKQIRFGASASSCSKLPNVPSHFTGELETNSFFRMVVMDLELWDKLLRKRR